jgi:hypothetical protein
MKIENKEELAKVLAISTENYKLEPENDCLLFQFIGAVMDLVEFKDGKLCLSDDARNILLFRDFSESLKDGKDQKNLTKGCLWLFIGYTLSVLFIGLLQIEDDSFRSAIPDEVKDVMNIAKERIIKTIPHQKKLLDHLVTCLNEEYAKIFDNEKRRMFHRDLFPHKVVVLADEEIPQEIYDSAIELKNETNNRPVQ